MLRSFERRASLALPVLVALSLACAATRAGLAQAVTQASAQPAGEPVAASKKALSVSDYSRWRAIEGAQISSDGKWVAYVLRYTNTLPIDSKPALHIRNLFHRARDRDP